MNKNMLVDCKKVLASGGSISVAYIQARHGMSYNDAEQVIKDFKTCHIIVESADKKGKYTINPMLNMAGFKSNFINFFSVDSENVLLEYTKVFTFDKVPNVEGGKSSKANDFPSYGCPDMGRSPSSQRRKMFDNHDDDLVELPGLESSFGGLDFALFDIELQRAKMTDNKKEQKVLSEALSKKLKYYLNDKITLTIDDNSFDFNFQRNNKDFKFSLIFLRDKGWFITDNGATLRTMDAQYALEAKDVQACIDKIAKTYGVQYNLHNASKQLLIYAGSLQNAIDKLPDMYDCSLIMLNMSIFFDEP